MAIGTPVGLGVATGNSVSSLAITTGANIVAGDLVVVAIGIANQTVSSVSDGTNTYAKAISNANTSSVELWYKANCAAVSSGASITVTFSGSANQIVICAARCSGITSTPLDKTANANTTSVSSGTLTQADELVFGVLGGYNMTSITEDAAFTNVYSQQDGATQVWVNLAYKKVSVTTSVTYAPTFTAAGLSVGFLVATFKGNVVVTTTLTGVAGTGAVGTVSPSVATTATGVAATGQVGTVTATSSSILLDITGVSGTGAVGSIAPTVTILPVGVSATGQVGVLVVTPSAIISGVSATGQVGVLVAGDSELVVGVVGVGQVGSVGVYTQFAVVGVAATGQVGVVFPVPPAPLHRPPLFIPASNGYPASIWAGD